MQKNDLTCTQKMKLLHDLMGIVKANMKREMFGKAGDNKKERNAAKKVLTSLLGRKPTEAELDLQLGDNWPLTMAECCKK